MRRWVLFKETPMDLSDLITREAVIPALKVKTKKQALQDLSQKAAKLTGLEMRKIFDALMQRENLGSTGVGRGIAVPHSRIAALRRITCVFGRLEEPIPFDALDDEPVDLIFLLLAPEHAGADHLKALARISRLLREPSTIEKLRSTRDRAVLYSVLTEPAASHAA
jgi:PTS system nitrogen regulatory IIA component